jgi:hypothetical protein
MVEAATTTSPVSAATVNAAMPEGRLTTGRASPPCAGSTQSAAFGSPFSVAPGSGRAEVNSSEPSGAQAGEDSPGALRVSRWAGRSPLGSTSQSADCHFFFSASRVCTEIARRVPSADRARPPIRGRAMKSASRWNGVGPGPSSVGCSDVPADWLTGAYSSRAAGVGNTVVSRPPAPRPG